MSWIEALILGVIQGLTEFLPVSSSGHLEIGSVLLGLSASNNLLFAITVHLATALATAVAFRKDIGQLVIGLFRKDPDTWRFALAIIISMIPVGIVGVLWKDAIETFFVGNMMLVGSMLLVTAILLAFSHFASAGDKSVGPFRALMIGVAQAIAVLPGISRSGATISSALLLGVDRAKAARFSFLMVIIPILGAALLKAKDISSAPEALAIDTFSLIIGFLAAFISGYFACKWMVRLVTQGRLLFFSIYCAIVGVIAILSQLI
jgi:undecaprenyl-diphosphatase